MNNDLISRSELKKAVTKWFIDERYYNPLDKPENMTESMLLSFINNAPAIKLERPQGEWKVNNYGEHVCPICGHYALYDECQDNDYYEVQSNFCPECGADLRGGSK